MAPEATAPDDGVGPVLTSGRVADAIVVAIKEENPGAQVTDRGSYLRVLVPRRCRVTRVAIETALSRPFHLPGDLELVMPSFRGRFFVSADQACWSVGAPPDSVPR
jgi:toluene monooxygenase system protein D